MPKSSRGSTKKKKPAKPAGRAPRPKANNGKPDALAPQFIQALELAKGGFLFDAVKRFEEIAKKDKKSEVADDALFNAGACFLRMGLYHDAIAYFTRVLQGFPDGKIHAIPGALEVGRTAAKAHLGTLHCYLALGQRDNANKELEALKEYTDSYVVGPDGSKKSFHQLGVEALAGK
jgi:TolA-binding protein